MTGGIGSGKSTACKHFSALGATCIDADAIARTLTAPGGAAIPDIIAAFGAGALAADGGIDRSAMRAQVFAHPDIRQRLEAILHPMIRAEIDSAVSAAQAPVVILDVPLLIESEQWRQRIDRVLVVDLPVPDQISRVRATRGLSSAQVEAIIANQATRAQRLAAADDVIFNSGSVADLLLRVGRLHAVYLAAASDRQGRQGGAHPLCRR